MGIGIAGDEEKTNQDCVMKKLRDCGYEMRCQHVSPTMCGVPMSRSRIHYQGLYAPKIATAKKQMDELAKVWDGVMKTNYPQIPLESFLLDNYAQIQTGHISTMGTMSDGKGKKWVAMHRDIFQQHEVGRTTLFVQPMAGNLDLTTSVFEQMSSQAASS